MEINIEITGATVNDSQTQHVINLVKRWISADWNPSPAIEIAHRLDNRISELIERGGGRFLRSSTFYEDFIKTICTINTNWGSTIRMASLLVNNLGEGTFPSPATIASSKENILRDQCKLGFRSPVILNSTNHLLMEQVIDREGNLNLEPPSYIDLLKMKGIGPYSASHIAMLEHDFRNIPIDSEVSKYSMEQLSVKPEDVFTLFDKWGDYRFLGYKLSRILDRQNWIGD